jgi:hypothetical protein
MASQANTPQIVLELEPHLVSRFARLFSKGVTVRAQTGCSLRDFICEQLGIPADYLEQRIQTIFLNGRAVDDTKSAVVTDGDSLALSAAMPGLVGAVFRRDGYYAALRNTVTYRREGAEARASDGEVTLKLFNLTVKELGPMILNRCVAVNGRDLWELMQDSAEEFCRGTRQIAFDGARRSFDDLLARIQAGNRMHLSVIETLP